MQVLVTGAAGFLGGHLVEMLCARGDCVRVLLRADDDVGHLTSREQVEVVPGDVTEISSLVRAMQGVQCVYHLAAATMPWGRLKEYHAVNVDGLANVIFAALSVGVARVVHTSALPVRGQHARGPITEAALDDAEDHPYSQSKIAGERLIARLVHNCRAPVVVVRPGWIYGACDIAGFARLASLIRQGRGYIIGSGKNVLPLVHVHDVVQALIRAGTAEEHVLGQAYTIIGEQRITQMEYLHAIADALGVRRVRCHLPRGIAFTAASYAERAWRTSGSRYGYPALLTPYDVALLSGDYQLSHERACRELGYEACVDLRRGVRESAQWYWQYVSCKERKPWGTSDCHVDGMIPGCASEQNMGESQRNICV